jgi:hypothetical protein
MDREIRRLVKKIDAIGKAAIEIYYELEKNSELLKIAVLAQLSGLEIQNAPELHLRDGKFKIDELEVLSMNMDKGRIHVRKENEIWMNIKNHKSYTDLVQQFQKMKSGITSSFLRHIENLTREFVHDITINIAMRAEDISKGKLEKEIQKRAKLLALDLHTSESSCGIVAPLLKLKIDAESIKIGDYAIIRPARYSENLEYSIGFSSRTGRSDFEYFLHLLPESLTPGRGQAKENFRLLAAVILALRLVFGGGVGTELAHYWMTLDPRKFGQIGQSHPTGESIINPSRFLKPGMVPSVIKKSQTKDVIEFIKILHPIVLAAPDKTMISLKRFGQAVEATDPTDSIIDSIISLECIFGGYSKKTIKMAALMLSKGQYPDVEVEELLTKCYDARNKIVHGASIETAEQAAGGNLSEKSEQLIEVVRNCIIQSLRFSDTEWENLRHSANE